MTDVNTLPHWPSNRCSQSQPTKITKAANRFTKQEGWWY